MMPGGGSAIAACTCLAIQLACHRYVFMVHRFWNVQCQKLSLKRKRRRWSLRQISTRRRHSLPSAASARSLSSPGLAMVLLSMYLPWLYSARMPSCSACIACNACQPGTLALCTAGTCTAVLQRIMPAGLSAQERQSAQAGFHFPIYCVNSCLTLLRQLVWGSRRGCCQC